MKRHAGLLLPLFSATSSRSWGIGELADLAPLSAWLSSSGFDRLMLLPIGVVAPGDTSPYAAQSAMAIDPMYIALGDLPEFSQAGGVTALDGAIRQDLEDARASERVDYARVRRVKSEALALAFDQFLRDEWDQLTMRAAALAGYVSRERWWLDDWALYSALAKEIGTPDWRTWPPPLRDRQTGAIDEARRHLGREVLRHQYLQWTAESQWQAARAEAAARGVTICGDLPFMVAAESPDVWVRPDEFHFDVSLGVPPDAFTATGQDWGLPTYRWERIAQHDYTWLRLRARRMAALFDQYRVDHLVGLYRTYGRPASGEPYFAPADEPSQIAQGETILRILLATGVPVIAEDLGLVPDFVRQSLARLEVPGCKVLRWERHWGEPGAPFIDPAAYPPVSAAMTGTHDTATVAEWWTTAGMDDRRAATGLPSMVAAGLTDPALPWDDGVRDALLEATYQSASTELYLPVQDVFGWTDRINLPASVGDHNWTWRLPWRVDELDTVGIAQERAGFCLRMARATNRWRVS